MIDLAPLNLTQNICTQIKSYMFHHSQGRKILARHRNSTLQMRTTALSRGSVSAVIHWYYLMILAVEYTVISCTITAGKALPVLIIRSNKIAAVDLTIF